MGIKDRFFEAFGIQGEEIDINADLKSMIMIISLSLIFQ